MTLAANTVHDEQRIDDLITKAIVNCFSNFEDIFLYVSKNYPSSNSQGFFFVVEKRFKALKRSGGIIYDHSVKAWTKSELCQ